MGQSASSSPSSFLQLKDASSSVLADRIVNELGPKYETYATAVRDNAVSGQLLDSMDEGAFQETLEDLQVTNRLHRRVLTSEWNKWKEEQQGRDHHEHTAVQYPSNQSKRRTSNKDVAREFAKGHPEYLLHHEITISENERQELVEAAASYELNEETPETELEGFDRTASKAFEQCHASYAGVHLLEDDGHFVLGARLRFNRKDDGVDVQQIRKDRIHAPKELSQCYGAIVANDSDLIVKTLEAGSSPFQTSQDEPSLYLAYILRTPDGKRIGVVCIEREEPDHQEYHAILKELAGEAEEQLRVRKALLRRYQTLQDQIHRLHQTQVVLPSFGPVCKITQEQLDKRGPPPYPMPDEIAATGKPRRTSTLPFAQENVASSPEEMSHLPDNYYQAADEYGADYHPVAKDDMQRIAVLESLRLTELTHDHPTGIALKRLVTLGARLFDVPHAEISFENHTESFTIATHLTCTEEQKASVYEFYHAINYDDTGEPWLMALPSNLRCLNLCSYTLSSKRTMAIHDVWKDESFKWLSEHNAFKFYCGSPIIVNGHVVATLCMMDYRVRPDFSQAHEMQQEQIAMLISQQIECWALRRDVERLEHERRQLLAPWLKASLPDRHAVLVFSDVQGSTSLWESNPHAMNEAIALHDMIMRKAIEKHHGFEVACEGDAFHVAFHDAIDAVCFALEVQIALHDAKWSGELLALPEACNSGNGFRGLCVRIAIHNGDVVSQDNQVSGRREFRGETYYVGKSLEGMAHGGQVLVTSDVWNIVSHLSESILGSPQVLDLGLHVLRKGKTEKDGIIAKRILQLVPLTLAYDYTKSRSLSNDRADDARTCCTYGRRFPPVRSLRRLSSSFHDAPYQNHQATMAFVYTTQIEDLFDDPSMILAVLSKRISTLLTDQPGYQCKDFMLVFSSMPYAISFGLKLQEYLRDHPVADHSLAGLVQFGLYEGEFSSMRPDKLTGRADYLGVAVNRAARVANATRPGEVYMGVNTSGSGDEDDAFAPEDKAVLANEGIHTSFVGKRHLKGVQEEMALYVCSRAG